MDILRQISSYQTIQDSFKLLLANKNSYEIYASTYFWAEKCQQYFGESGTIKDFISKYQTNLVFDSIASGRNVFITGQAGTGKSHLVKLIKQKYKHIKLTSSTGVSSYLIGSCTFHSFFGVGIAKNDKSVLLRYVQKNERAKFNILDTKSIIIDEVSMLSINVFEKVDYICKTIRKCQKPFGGIQVIFVGDFFQLPPVDSNSLLFESDIWKELNPKSVHLKIVHRQEEEEYSSLLSRVRDGSFTREDIKKLKTRIVEPPKDIPHIFCKKDQSNEFNTTRLNSLRQKLITFGKQHTVSVYDKKCAKKAEDRCVELLRDLPFPDILSLKVGARVMLKVNLDLSKGLVNGSIGTVVEITGFPHVVFDNGTKKIIGLHEFSHEEDGFDISIRVVPLVLAWSFTVHSVQGCTLEYALVDISSCFTYGQAYVALSRIKSLNGLYLTDFSKLKITSSQKVKRYYDTLH